MLGYTDERNRRKLARTNERKKTCTPRSPMLHVMQVRPASVAQLDARPSGDQEVAGSAPASSATFFHGG